MCDLARGAGGGFTAQVVGFVSRWSFRVRGWRPMVSFGWSTGRVNFGVGVSFLDDPVASGPRHGESRLWWRVDWVPFEFAVSGTRRIDSMAVADVEPADEAAGGVQSEPAGTTDTTDASQNPTPSECVGGRVLLCQAPAEIVSGLVDHRWLKTDKVEAGMGGDIEAPGEQYEAPFVTKVHVTDHSGQSVSREGAECEPVPGLCVNKVEEQLEVGRPLGRFIPLLNDCGTFCDEVIRNSRDPSQEREDTIDWRNIEIYP